MEIVMKEKNPAGCDQLIPPTPCRYFVIKEGKKEYVEVNPDDYKEIGFNKDVVYFSKIL